MRSHSDTLNDPPVDIAVCSGPALPPRYHPPRPFHAPFVSSPALRPPAIRLAHPAASSPTLIIPVSLISSLPPVHQYSSSLSYSPLKLKMGCPPSAIPRTTRYGCLPDCFVAYTRHVNGSFGSNATVSRSVLMEHIIPQQFPSFYHALKRNVRLVIRTPPFNPAIWLLFFALFHAFHDFVCHDTRPSSVPSAASPTFTRPQFLVHPCHQLSTHRGQCMRVRCLHCPTDVQLGTRHWLLSIWVSVGLGVEVQINGSGWLTSLKLSLVSSPPVEGYDRDWILFISYETPFCDFRWYLGTMNGQT